MSTYCAITSLTVTPFLRSRSPLAARRSRCSSHRSLTASLKPILSEFKLSFACGIAAERSESLGIAGMGRLGMVGMVMVGKRPSRMKTVGWDGVWGVTRGDSSGVKGPKSGDAAVRAGVEGMSTSLMARTARRRLR